MSFLLVNSRNMARLFITPREVNFISDITKELIKDINGQKVFYYPISEVKSKVHELYQESIKKVYDNPIMIDALVGSPEVVTTITEFGPDQGFTIEAWFQYRDLIDKGIEVVIGDYFSFGDVMYEITKKAITRNIYGRAEDKDGITVTGTQARKSLFDTDLIGPTDRKFTDPDAVQSTFYQQRGFKENKEGLTADVRYLQQEGLVTPIVDEPAEVSKRGDDSDGQKAGNAFYGEDED